MKLYNSQRKTHDMNIEQYTGEVGPILNTIKQTKKIATVRFEKKWKIQNNAHSFLFRSVPNNKRKLIIKCVHKYNKEFVEQN